MQFDQSYQNRYMAYPMDPREQDGYAMNGYGAAPPGMFCAIPIAFLLVFQPNLARPFSSSSDFPDSVQPQPRKRSRIPASGRCFESQSRSRRLCRGTTSGRSSGEER
jgi:hypothetical protein